jgi:hypothetical protein
MVVVAAAWVSPTTLGSTTVFELEPHAARRVISRQTAIECRRSNAGRVVMS